MQLLIQRLYVTLGLTMVAPGTRMPEAVLMSSISSAHVALLADLNDGDDLHLAVLVLHEELRDLMGEII